jgi:hypothetical protein
MDGDEATRIVYIDFYFILLEFIEIYGYFENLLKLFEIY